MTQKEVYKTHVIEVQNDETAEQGKHHLSYCHTIKWNETSLNLKHLSTLK
jgi:hypothetical protein